MGTGNWPRPRRNASVYYEDSSWTWPEQKFRERYKASCKQYTKSKIRRKYFEIFQLALIFMESSKCTIDLVSSR